MILIEFLFALTVPSLPDISVKLGATVARTQLTLSIFLLVGVVVLLLFVVPRFSAILEDRRGDT